MKNLLFILFSLSVIFLNAQEEEFYFVQITDTHLGSKEHDTKTKEIIKQINNLPYEIDFVVHTGDIFADNLSDSKEVFNYKKIIEKLECTIYIVPGNHDIHKRNFKEEYKLYNSIFDTVNTVFTNKGVTFIMIYTEPFNYASLDMHKQQFSFLDSVLKENADNDVIVCHHSPSVIDFYNNKEHETWNPALRLQWKITLNKYDNVIAILAGHFHRAEQYWVGDIPLYVAPSIASYWGRQASYRIYHYKDNKLSYRTVYIEY